MIQVCRGQVRGVQRAGVKAVQRAGSRAGDQPELDIQPNCLDQWKMLSREREGRQNMAAPILHQWYRAVKSDFRHAYLYAFQ